MSTAGAGHGSNALEEIPSTLVNPECISVVQLCTIGTVASKDVQDAIHDRTRVTVSTRGQVSRCGDGSPCQSPGVETPYVVIEIVGIGASKDVDFVIKNAGAMSRTGWGRLSLRLDLLPVRILCN